MLIYALKRFGVAILVALTVSILSFSMLYLSGDPAIALAVEGASQEDIENVLIALRRLNSQRNADRL